MPLAEDRSLLLRGSDDFGVHGVGRQNVDRALELAFFSAVNHHLLWPSACATSSRAGSSVCRDLADGQLWTRTSSSWCCATRSACSSGSSMVAFATDAQTERSSLRSAGCSRGGGAS